VPTPHRARVLYECHDSRWLIDVLQIFKSISQVQYSGAAAFKHCFKFSVGERTNFVQVVMHNVSFLAFSLLKLYENDFLVTF